MAKVKLVKKEYLEELQKEREERDKYRERLTTIGFEIPDGSLIEPWNRLNEYWFVGDDSPFFRL